MVFSRQTNNFFKQNENKFNEFFDMIESFKELKKVNIILNIYKIFKFRLLIKEKAIF